MGKVYDANGTKLNNVQVTELLMNDMPLSHVGIIRQALDPDIKNFRSRFAHAILDCYKDLPSETQEEENSKKYCRHLMEKYMKSTAPGDGEESVMQLLIDTINKDITE